MSLSEAQQQLRIPPVQLLVPPSGYNPTVMLFLALVVLLILSNFGYWFWQWPHWLCFSINTMCLHCAGTVVHDACHQAAHRNPTINAILGHISAVVLVFSFPVFTRVHLQHHSHVNHPQDDPDHYVSTGGPLWLIAVRFLYHEVFFFQRKLWRDRELWEWLVERLIVISLFCLAIKYHFLGYILNFWFIPAFLVGITLGLFFDYLPHCPFKERDRWKNARVYPNPVLNILILGQNYHLVHHLWPSITWYNYQPAYYLMKPLLDEKGCNQTLGIFQKQDFPNFLYDLFIGIHRHNHPE